METDLDPRASKSPPESRSEGRETTRIVWALAWPTVLLNGLQLLNGLLDTFYVSQLPKSALTAHGGSMNVIFLMFSVVMTLSVASTALVSRAFGAQKMDEVRDANRQCVAMAHYAGVAMFLLCIGLAFVTPTLFIPAENPEARRIMKDFLIADAFCFPAVAIVQTLAGSMRGIGDSKSPLVISGIQILIHMVLNPFFIMPSHRVVIGGETLVMPGLGLGLPGGAIALTIGAVLSAIGYLAYAGRTPLGKSWAIAWPEPQWSKRILNIAWPAALQALLRVLSFSVFTVILKGVAGGSDALAALRVGIAIESLMFMPAFGLSMAASALVGQSLGAQDPDKAYRLGWSAAHWGAAVIFVLSIPIFIWAPQIAALLSNAKNVGIVAMATSYIRILIVTEVLFGYAMILIGGMQGAGDTRRTTWITAVSLWGIRVPVAYLLAPTMGATGCWIAMSSTQLLQGALAIWLWKRGGWRSVKV